MPSRQPGGKNPPPYTKRPYNFYTRPMRPVRVPPTSPQTPARPFVGYDQGPARVKRSGNTRQIRPITSVPIPALHTPALGSQSIPMPPPSRAAAPRRRMSPPRRPARQRGLSGWLIGLIAAPLMVGVLLCGLLTVGGLLLFGGGNTLPGVQSLGVMLGGMSEREAAGALSAAWQNGGVKLAAGRHTLPVAPDTLGLSLDAAATARRALDYGRADGGLGAALNAVFGQVEIAPVVSVDETTLANGLRNLAAQIEQPPVNAGVQLVAGQVQPRPAVTGSALDIEATLANLRQQGASALADGTLELVMIPVLPTVKDAAPLVAQAAALLTSPLDIRLYDPAQDSSTYWVVQPEVWSQWLQAEPDSSSSLGLRLGFEPTGLTNYLSGQMTQLDDAHFINLDEGIAAVQKSIAVNRTDPTIRLYTHDRQHVVQAGETIISIAWDYGVPYPWIQKFNPGVGDSLSPGQTITIPSPDNFLPYPINPDKRIVVSIGEQRVRVYEGGGLKWDWVASTGISSSPTWTGVYQVLLHDPNAYAGNWDLWMPNFLGVYHPIPDADFVNGFHGFPTRGSSQLLWTNSLGTRVTYGCILLSNENAQALYDWAEEGVVVEIQA